MFPLFPLPFVIPMFCLFLCPDADKAATRAEIFKAEGKKHYGNNEYEEALHAFTKALDIAPSTWPHMSSVLGNRAATLMMIDRCIEAAEDCERALMLSPETYRLHERRGRALLRVGLLAQAEEAFTRMLETPSIRYVSSSATYRRTDVPLIYSY